MLRVFSPSLSDCIIRLACTNHLCFPDSLFRFLVCFDLFPRPSRCKYISVWWNELILSHHCGFCFGSLALYFSLLAEHLPSTSSFWAICWQMMWLCPCPCPCDWHPCVCAWGQPGLSSTFLINHSVDLCVLDQWSIQRKLEEQNESLWRWMLHKAIYQRSFCFQDLLFFSFNEDSSFSMEFCI